MAAPDDAIGRALAEYCRRCDDGDFDALADLFAADATLEVRGDVIVGRSAVRAWYEAAQTPERRGKHVSINALVDVDGDEAVAQSDFLFLRFDQGMLRVASAGRYDDRFVRVGERWLLARRVIDMMAPPPTTTA